MTLHLVHDSDPTPPHGVRRPNRWRVVLARPLLRRLDRHRKHDRKDCCAHCVRSLGYVTEVRR